MLKWQNWGHRLQSYTDETHNNYIHCPFCLYYDENAFNDYIVGFATERGNSSYSTGAGSCGVVTIECPKCSEHSWRHFYVSLPLFASSVENGFREFKVPGALKAFQTMLKRAKKLEAKK